MEPWSWLAEDWILTTWKSYPYYGIMHNCKLSIKCPADLEPPLLIGSNGKYEGCQLVMYPHAHWKVLGQKGIWSKRATNKCLSCGEEIPKAIAFLVGMMEAGHGV